jgi:alkanesulfonate monooxygenase SsuD/methylene tetrahydromethanopterin reductase-like flavin-dependent oxidoreductase (luciferase family)
MRFGYLKTVYGTHDGDTSASHTAWSDLAVAAEAMGFSSAWTTQHHFASDPGYRPFGVSDEEYASRDYDMTPDPFVLLSHVAARTSTLRLGIGVAVPMWEHPLTLVERAVMLDNLSGGRLELGISRGIGPLADEVFGAPSDPVENRRKYEEAVELVRVAWRGERFSWDGEFFQVPELALRPTPLRPEAPIWIGSASMGSTEMAARMGLPYVTVTWPIVAVETYFEKMARYREVAAAAGHDVSDFDLPHLLHMYCDESDERAARIAYDAFIDYQLIIEQSLERSRFNPEHWGTEQERLPPRENLDRLARYPVEHHLIGTPETIAERLRWFVDTLEMRYCIIVVGFGGMDDELTYRSMELFFEHVAPRFAPETAAVRLIGPP